MRNKVTGEPIALQVFNRRTNHFVVTFARPGRIEVMTTADGAVVAHVYEGAAPDPEQEPLGAFDGTLPARECRGWRA